MDWVASSVPPDKIAPARLAIAAKMSIRGHILTGPIYIEGAEAGHALELQIPKV